MSNNIRFHFLKDLSQSQRQILMQRAEDDLAPFIDQVKPVIAAVKEKGDEALIAYARQFDGAALQSVKVLEQDIMTAPDGLAPDIMEAIDYGLAHIRRYHEAQKPQSWWKEIERGIHAGERWTAIESAVCYVPRGKGSFPSVAMMTAVPAIIAGVPRLGLFTPPGKDGKGDKATLAVAQRLGIRDVYLCGGAQAVAAAAYGTETISPYEKIVGPGSPYFLAAKALLADRIDPGIPAGPSEALILADDSADPYLAMMDLLIEAEHGADSSCFLVTWSKDIAEKAAAHFPALIGNLSAERAAHARAVLTGNRGGIVIAPDRQSALDFVNDYAAEHLLIHSEDPFAYLDEIHHAGEILLGRHTPNTIANFVLGPNAVLPTAGAARLHSALSVFDFMKRTSLGYVTSAGYPAMAKHARRLAEYEGFDAHAQAVATPRD